MPGTTRPPIHLSRWTVTSGSNARSRGAVVIESGESQWRAAAEGNGAIDALFRAVDTALAEILDGHPRLLAYDIHALGEGTDSQGAVTVVLAPPDAAGARGTGEYKGEARAENIIAASIEAYLEALNAMLAEAHWQGAPEAAAARTKKPTKVTESAARSGRAELDEAAGEIDTVDWFNQ